MITLVVRDRRPILGRLEGNPSRMIGTQNKAQNGAQNGAQDRVQNGAQDGAQNGDAPHVVLTPLGEAVEHEFLTIPNYYPQITIISQQVMPDHWHGLLFVKDTLPRNLSMVLSGFQGGCSRAMWDIEDIAAGRDPAERPPQKVHQRPGLFEKGFNDGIVWRAGQLDKYKNYIADNPRRALLRKLYPDLMRRCLHIQIDGRDYAAFGNIFLLRRPDKQQVFCHRWEQKGENPSRMLGAQDEGINGTQNEGGIETQDARRRYDQTEAFAEKREQWLMAARQGTVLVTPGISKGEQILKVDCIRDHLPLIHIQREPIGRYWKPEESRFYACAAGSLLILAPWSLTEMGDTTKKLNNGTTIRIAADSDYSQFHNMNKLAAEICDFEGAARIIPIADARGTER